MKLKDLYTCKFMPEMLFICEIDIPEAVFTHWKKHISRNQWGRKCFM